MPARPSPALMASLRAQRLRADVSSDCQITKVTYAGDEGGIMCQLNFGGDYSSEAILVSITYLVFDRRRPIAREIAAYHKHRRKRIRRENALGALAAYR